MSKSNDKLTKQKFKIRLLCLILAGLMILSAATIVISMLFR